MLIDWVANSLFNEIAALLVLAAVVGAVGVMLRQPLIVSFIAVGILAGPSALGITQSSEAIELLAQLGIAILLFLVGIKLDLTLVRTLGTVALATGLGQVAFTSVFGFLICLALGLDALTSLYVAVALTFSSTIIIVKLLSDKREIDSLHGRIALGFLIVQDLVVVLAMISLSAIGVGMRGDGGPRDVLAVLVAGLIMLGLVIVFIRYLANPLTARLSRVPELLLCFAIALAVSLAAIGDTLGFGKELGGLLAGVALASTPYRDAIAARLAPLRDFLLLFFFVVLGAQLDLGALGAAWIPAAILSAFVLIGNPLIVLAIMVALGYRRRTGFLAGLTVAQISEFSLIFMAVGVGLGHVSELDLGLVTLVGLVTIALSTYMITYSHELWALFEPYLRLPERPGRREDRPTGAHEIEGFNGIILGLGRYGSAIGRRLEWKGYRLLGVDFNPEALATWRQTGRLCLYGDASDPEFLASLPLGDAQWVISTVRDPHLVGIVHADSRAILVQALRERGFEKPIIVTAARVSDKAPLRAAGADLVLEPFADAADRAVERVLGDSSEAPEPAVDALDDAD